MARACNHLRGTVRTQIGHDNSFFTSYGAILQRSSFSGNKKEGNSKPGVKKKNINKIVTDTGYRNL
ncbi:hypothetical protein NNO_1599 [Hydrogenimonas sp.]|nr:hypothetical protein NNO_1599 [Hydrogenimonas sp.]